MSLSVIISTYNHAHYLTECLDSILSQEEKVDEVIIIDDASTDSTKELVSAYQINHPKIVFLTNPKNLGPAVSLNKALALAKGDYIIGCAADDMVIPGFFEKGIEILKANPSLGFCCGDTFHFYDRKPYSYQFLKTLAFDESKIFDKENVPSLFRSKIFTIQSHACIYRKQCLIDCGGFIPELKSLCDWYLNISIALKWGFAYAPQPFAAYRLVEGSYANTNSKIQSIRMNILESLFGLLNKAENSEIKLLFRSCYLFSQLNYRYFYDFATTPSFWYMTLPSFPAKLKKLFAKRLQNLAWKVKGCLKA